MKKAYLLLIFIFCLIANANSQSKPTFNRSQLSALADDISSKAEQLCEYIVAVGSTNSGVSDARKDEIIRYNLKPLFWNYYERVMKTTGGAYGTVVRTKPMQQYFTNLKAQARYNPSRQVKYELAYDEVYSINTLLDLDSWEKLDNLSDGCVVWRNSIKIRQKYFVIDYTLNNSERPGSSKISHFEQDDKYLYVYIIQTPNKQNIARLGDVYMTIRTETINVK